MLSAKAVGARHLASATCLTPLNAFILFSSVGSGLGNVGQASYAAANAYLDALAPSLAAEGIVAAAVQWPLISGAGMGAAEFGARASLGYKPALMAPNRLVP